MKARKTFSIPFAIKTLLDTSNSLTVNRTITLHRAIAKAYKQRRQFVDFVENNLDNDAFQSYITLISLNIENSTLKKLEELKEALSKKVGVNFSLSRTLSFVLLHYFSPFITYRMPVKCIK